MLHIQAPNLVPGLNKPGYLGPDDKRYVFLAGSIEMGAAEKWQDKIVEALQDYPDDLIVVNPRRDDWDSSWEQSIENAQFYEQVTWELDNLEQCDLVVVYFAVGTQSPITLLELGKLSMQFGQAVIVCCPDGFWRKGNVDIICERAGFQVVETLSELIGCIKTYYKEDSELSV